MTLDVVDSKARNDLSIAEHRCSALADQCIQLAGKLQLVSRDLKLVNALLRESAEEITRLRALAKAGAR